MDFFGCLGEARGPGIAFEATVIKICLASEALPACDWNQRFDANGVRSARYAHALVPVYFYVAWRTCYCAAVRDVNAEHPKFKCVSCTQAVCTLHRDYTQE